MKKGELTTQQIVILIILVTSFAVLLFLFFRLNPVELTKKEICHNSVILKSKSAVSGASLDCSTSYVCISGGGECEDIVEDYKIEVDAANEEEIFNAITEEMVECYWMFGEGEVDYLGGIKTFDTVCSICSMISFDEEIKNYYNLNNNGNIKTFNNFYQVYLFNNQKSNSQTYLQYFYGTNDVNEIKRKFYSILKINPMGGIISVDENYVIATGIKEGLGIGFFDLKKNSFISPFFIKQSDVKNINCERFLTKA